LVILINIIINLASDSLAPI